MMNTQDQTPFAVFTVRVVYVHTRGGMKLVAVTWQYNNARIVQMPPSRIGRHCTDRTFVVESGCRTRLQPYQSFTISFCFVRVGTRLGHPFLMVVDDLGPVSQKSSDPLVYGSRTHRGMLLCVHVIGRFPPFHDALRTMTCSVRFGCDGNAVPV